MCEGLQPRNEVEFGHPLVVAIASVEWDSLTSFAQLLIQLLLMLIYRLLVEDMYLLANEHLRREGCEGSSNQPDFLDR